ncbi:MAG: aminofutalosine synthase MqnE, partial [Nitrospinota bacterium]
MSLEALLLKSELAPIYRKVRAGERLTFQDGLTLYRTEDVLGLGYMANLMRERLNGNRAYYVVNQHINYSNICKNHCRFCAFRRRAGEEGAYTMSVEEVLARARAEGNGTT